MVTHLRLTGPNIEQLIETNALLLRHCVGLSVSQSVVDVVHCCVVWSTRSDVCDAQIGSEGDIAAKPSVRSRQRQSSEYTWPGAVPARQHQRTNGTAAAVLPTRRSGNEQGTVCWRRDTQQFRLSLHWYVHLSDN